MLRIAAVFVILSLAACGVRGPLELPQGPAPEPLLGNSKATGKQAPAPAAQDVSTPSPTNDQ